MRVYRGPKIRTLSERFWEKVTKTDGCWLWRGTLTNGYGRVYSNKLRRPVFAHRASWELKNGSIPQGMWVLHKCDTPSCVRPDHLFLGTAADNVEDMHNKKRAWAQVYPELARANGRIHLRHLKKNFGERSSNSKLTEVEARSIVREHWLDGKNFSSLAKKYDVSSTAVSCIIKGKSWPHLLVGYNG